MMTVQTTDAFKRSWNAGLSMKAKIRVQAYIASRRRAPARARIRLSFIEKPPFVK